MILHGRSVRSFGMLEYDHLCMLTVFQRPFIRERKILVASDVVKRWWTCFECLAQKQQRCSEDTVKNTTKAERKRT